MNRTGPPTANGVLPPTAAPAPADDPRVVAALEEYLDAAESGRRPDRRAFLVRHADIAGELARCLDGLDFVRAAATHLEPGDAGFRPGRGPATLGDFRILRELGRGGMGVVYEAVQVSLKRRVALKVLPFTASLDPRQLQRFQNESEAAARLVHPHIVPVYAVGSERGVPYFAMQLIDGRNLAAVLHELRGGGHGGSTDRPVRTDAGPEVGEPPADDLPPGPGTPILPRAGTDEYVRTVAGWAAQAAEALDHAHQCGVIHRDVKPANLLLDGRGHLWVTDFGLARFPGAGGPTRTGDLLGTLRYMSPEQALAKPAVVDHRTDVYALGATLYELLTLRPVFDTEDAHELMCRTAHEEPVSPRRRDLAVPSDLETVVLKALEKDPAQRYQTAGDLAADLRRFLADEPVLARRPALAERARRWARRHPSTVAAAAVVGVVVLAAAVFCAAVFRHERDEARRKEELTRRAEELTRRAADEMYTACARDWLADQPHLTPVQERFLNEALAIYRELLSRQPADPSLRRETANCYRRVGEILHRLGRSREALDAHEQSVALLEELPADADLALSRTERAHVLREAGRLPEAEADYRRAQELFARIAAERPDDAEAAVGLAGSHNNLGLVLTARGQPDAAAASFRDAVAGFAELVRRAPERSGCRHDLASAHNNLGHVLRDAGRTADAEAAYAEAVELWQRLTDEQPDRAVYRQGLAVAHNNRGILVGALGRTTEAEQEYRRALELRQGLADKYPQVPAYRRDLAATCNGLGTLLLLAGRLKDAEEQCRRSVELRRRLVEEFPGRTEYRDDLTAGYEGLARVLTAAGRPTEAEAVRHAGRGSVS
jgi:eukaryotic-like serine/threonine-protein kinase